MKKSFFSQRKTILGVVTFLLLTCQTLSAQVVEYKTFVYTNDELANDISKLNDERDSSRGYLGDLLSVTTNSMKGIASGYVSTFFDIGVNAIGQLVTRRERQKKEWEEAVKKENVYQTVINSVSEMSDFYDAPSFDGAMDPKGMRFDGIGCLRTEAGDTTFYISCHIDRDKLHRIINHSKFELVLDTLILSPTHSSLPNTQLSIPFSFIKWLAFCTMSGRRRNSRFFDSRSTCRRSTSWSMSRCMVRLVAMWAFST